MLENSCAPTIVAYTELIEWLCKVGKIDEAFKLLTMVGEKRCNPNVVSYIAIIDEFGKAKKKLACSPNFIST